MLTVMTQIIDIMVDIQNLSKTDKLVRGRKRKKRIIWWDSCGNGTK